jgi:hypothetical protein
LTIDLFSGKLLGKFPSVAFQLKSILRSMSNAFTVLFLLAICLFVMAIFAVNTFGGRMKLTNMRAPAAQVSLYQTLE